MMAKQLKRQSPRVKYRNIKVTETGVTDVQLPDGNGLDLIREV